MKVVLPPLPNGRAVFCDDIRYEIGGKSTLVGIYNGAMFFPKETAFPLIVPKLGIAISWHEPSDSFANVVTFKATFVDMDADPTDLNSDGQFLIEQRYDLREMAKASHFKQETSPNRIAMLLAYMMVSPFAVPHPGKVRVRAFRDDQILAVGALRVEALPT